MNHHKPPNPMGFTAPRVARLTAIFSRWGHPPVRKAGTKVLWGLALTPAALALAACAGAAPSEPVPKLQDVRYRCANGVELTVSYLNAASGESFASMPYQGHTAVLENRPSASGARYVDQNEQQGLRWHTQGDAAFLSVMPPDHTASERILLADCRAIPAR